MKKIVGILAAAAVLATSVFAADVSAKVQLEGNLFNYGTDKSMSMFDINKPSDQHWNPVFNLSTSSDTAGAEFVVYTGTLGSNGSWNKAFDNGSNRFKIWFSPIENVKLIFGLNGFKLNEEKIRWSKSDSGAEDYGYSLNYSKDGLSIDLALLPGWGTAWMSKADGGDAVINTTAFKLAYSADFGTIGALFVAKPSADKEGKAKNFNDLKFGASYANTFDGINAWVNVLAYQNNDFQKIRAELYASGNSDAFGWSIFPVVEIYTADHASPWQKDGKNEGPVEIFLIAKATYQLDACQAYFEFADLQGLLHFGKAGNTWDGNNAANFKLGATGNIGGASWDVAAQLIMTDKVAFSVPVVFSFGW